ncbi:MAG: mechanosensitive ion channel [Gammaproteobacteria bacterium]|nr:mechanosensitive ion channel [Gammaproteobacteria bacterium]MDH4254625.1 mechanosensitive ion channel [Gammaproteobacteria bacterium]MDH5309453.1 mechanosensitive ion channel [Gammaproteobacteria bacterium]
MDKITEFFVEYWRIAFDWASQPAIFIQLVIIAAAFVPALLLSWRIEPLLEERARAIKGMPGLLRFIVAFLRRLEWLFLVILLGIGYVVTTVLQWPGSNYLIYAVMLLSLAWLVISVMSHVIRSRALGRLFAIAGWLYVAGAILGLTAEIAAVLDSAGFQVGNFRFSVLNVLKTVVFLGALLWIASSLGNYFDQRIQRSDELTPSLRVLVGKVLRIVLIIVAALTAMSALGIDLTAFTVLSGAVGVGIGFGLQKVVSNFISGIIILLDESIKPGDTISLGDTFGWIRELRARFVSVVTRDGREFLIPNEDFITREVINWSFSDDLVRLDVPFGVSYDSNPHDVTRLAIEAAQSVERVVGEERPPVCWMTAFGDSSLDFLLRFWIRDPQNGLTNIKGKVLLALWDRFREHGIAIPYPHREIIVKTPLRVSTEANSQ